MSGAIGSNSINYALLFPASTQSAGGISAGLLSAYYGGTGNIGSTGENPITALQIAQTNQTKDIALQAKTPVVARDIAAFVKAVQAAKTPADLLNNPTVLNVLLTANGLGSESGFTALAQKALLSNPSDPKSLVNQLASSNSKWLATAQTFDFANKGLSIIQNPKVISTITNGYAEVLWRQTLDQQTPGLSNALDFLQRASSFTSALQILGDPVLRAVVTTATGVPQQIAFQDIPAQEQAITSHLDIPKLQDPKFVQGLADLYLTNMAATAKQNAASGSSASLTSLAVQSQGLIA